MSKMTSNLLRRHNPWEYSDAAVMPSSAQLQGQHNTTEHNSHQKKELGATFTPTQMISKENVGKTQSHNKDSIELKQHGTAPHKVSNSAWVWRSYLTLQHTVEKFFPTKLCFIFNHQLSLKNEKQKKQQNEVWLHLGGWMEKLGFQRSWAIRILSPCQRTSIPEGQRRKS